jgi:beta-glucuronosyltransferase
MLEAKPPSPSSSCVAGAAAHIHAHRRWAAPLLASVMLSSLLIFASLFSSSSRALLLSFSPLPSAATADPLFVEAKLRQQMRAEERPTRSAVPRIAYLVSGSAGDGAALRRTLRARYHPANTYVVHLDLEAPAAERAELAAAVRADPFYARFHNVKVVTRANLVTYRGPTMVSNTLHAAAILLREGGDWDWFINLLASDYPLVTQDDKRRCDLPPSPPGSRMEGPPQREIGGWKRAARRREIGGRDGRACDGSRCGLCGHEFCRRGRMVRGNVAEGGAHSCGRLRWCLIE